MHFFHHLIALTVAMGLIWLPGWWLVRRSPLPGADLRFLARFSVGLAFWIATLFALAASGLFHGAAMLAVIALLLLLAGRDLWNTRRIYIRGQEQSQEQGGATRHWRDWVRENWPFVALGASIILPILTLAMTPSVSWDADVYHLTLPRIYLDAGGFSAVPMSIYSHWPQGLELLFGAAMALDGYVLAKLLHFGCGLLVVVGLRRLLPGRAGWLAAALFLVNSVVLFEMRAAYIDLAHAFALLAGAALAAQASREQIGAGQTATRVWTGTVALTGLTAGLLMSLKVTGVVSAACLALLLIPRWWREASLFGTRGLGRSVLAFAAPCAVLGAPWWIKTWIMTGNPLYPWFWRHFGGPDWSVEVGQQFGAWQRGIGMGREWIDYALLPWRVIVEGGQGYGRFDGEIGLFWLAALPLALVAAKSSVPRSWLWRPMLLVALLHTIFWSLSSQQMRFLIPVLALLAAPAAAGAAALLRPWLIESSQRRRLVAALALVLTATVALLEHGKVLGSGALLLPAFLHPTAQPRDAAPPVFAEIDRLPPDAKLLFLNTNRGFFSPRPFIADSFFEASQINTWLRDADSVQEVQRRLRERSVTHVLFGRLAGGGLPYPEPLLDLLTQPATAQGIYADEQYLLLVLK